MSNPCKDFWETLNVDEAWQKIVLGPENPVETQQASEFILNGIPRGGTVLEVGAGLGRLMRAVSPHFERVWGMDISESMVAMSKGFLKDCPTCEIKLGDGHRLPFVDGMFDFVYSYITFQHMPDLECVRSNIAEILRVLKVGGSCRVQTLKGASNSPVVVPGWDGYRFEREEDFREEFSRYGFNAKAYTTSYDGQPIVLWVDGKKK